MLWCLICTIVDELPTSINPLSLAHIIHLLNISVRQDTLHNPARRGGVAAIGQIK